MTLGSEHVPAMRHKEPSTDLVQVIGRIAIRTLKLTNIGAVRRRCLPVAIKAAQIFGSFETRHVVGKSRMSGLVNCGLSFNTVCGQVWRIKRLSRSLGVGIVILPGGHGNFLVSFVLEAPTHVSKLRVGAGM